MKARFVSPAARTLCLCAPSTLLRALSLSMGFVPLCLLLPAATAASAGEVSFAAKPTATKDGDKVKIAFTLAAPADVEVAVVDAQGKVVRSLAAGVLGAKNPPPEPLKPGLAQELVWDGKGDWNLPAGSGPFKVRVRAGMGVKFGRTIGADSPYNIFSATACRGLAVDPKNGDLYVLAVRQLGNWQAFLRVFDRTGKYLREIMPYAPEMLEDPKGRGAFGSVSVPDAPGPLPMSYATYWPAFHPFFANEGSIGTLLGMHPGEKDTLVFLSGGPHALFRLRSTDGGPPEGGALSAPLWEKGQKAPGYCLGPASGAFSSDGKTFYFTGFCGQPAKGQKLHAQWPEGRVYKLDAGAGAKTFVDVALPDDAPPPFQGTFSPINDNQSLHGLAVDKAGRVFVCDQGRGGGKAGAMEVGGGGGKVAVFTADGQPAGSVPLAGAWMCVPDDKTGALYVLTKRQVGYWRYERSLVKFDGWKEGAKVVSEIKFPVGGDPDVFLAADFTGPAPQLWVANCPSGGAVLRIEDKDGKLVIAENLADRGKKGDLGWACRIDVDPEADLVYVYDGRSGIVRYNGLTGERDGSLVASEYCVRRDGVVYVSGTDGGYSGGWSCLGRDLKPAPLPGGAKQIGSRYGKMAPFTLYGSQGAAVTPDGHLYYNSMFWFRVNMVLALNPDGSPGKGTRMAEHFAGNIGGGFDPYTKLGFKGALVGLLQDRSGGVEVDQQGNVYVGLAIRPRDFVLPGDLEKLAKRGGLDIYQCGIGSAVKFGPDGGGMLPDPAQCKPGTKFVIGQNNPPNQFTAPEKAAPGLPMGTGQRFCWNEPHWNILMEGATKAYPMLGTYSVGCACKTPRFEVDDYGRLYIPSAYTCSVQVVDNEGNEITKFGYYGNYDNGGPESAKPKPAIPLAYPMAAKASFKHIYVADEANRRVVRLEPTWKGEETCEVK
jgi:hypothetical protein